MNKPTPMHLTLSLAGQGYHAAAWAASSPAAAGADSVPSYRSLVQQAQAAGFDSVFMTAPPAGSAAPHLDTMPLLGTLVAPTGRIGLGATVDVAHTEPFHTARAFAVLDNLSGGRTAWLVDLSLPPPGDADFAHRPVLDAAAHYQRAEEYIEVAMKLWDSWEDDAVVTDKAAGVFADDRRIHPIHHRGTHFTVRGPLTAVRPLQGHPVLVFDDLSPEGRRIAARFADVVLASCASAEEATTLVAGLRDQAEACGRSRDAIRILLNIVVLTGPSAAAAQDRAAGLDAMTDESPSAQGHRFVGRAAELCDLMARWHGASGCDGFNLLPAMLPQDVDALVADVVPMLQARGMFRTRYEALSLRGHLGLARPANQYAKEVA